MEEIRLVEKGEGYRFKNKCKTWYPEVDQNYYVLDKCEICYMVYIVKMHAYMIINHIMGGKLVRIKKYDLGEYEHHDARLNCLPSHHKKAAKKLLEYCEHVFIINKLADYNNQ